ncbi:S8 family serine peptidase, partial [bacterium]|nr:S8 family serine peptidase [bacterium]
SHCDTAGRTRISPYEYYANPDGGLASFAPVNPHVGGTVTSPGTTPGAITVGAYSDEDRGLCTFSGYGPPRSRERYAGLNYYKPDICAPGYEIIAALPSWTAGAAVGQTAIGKKNGTSMAAPMVAGMVALLLQNSPNLTAAEIKEKLFDAARLDLCTGSSAGDYWGHGKLDARVLPIEETSIFKVTACGDSAEYAYVYVANADDAEPSVSINGQPCSVCVYEPSADIAGAKAIKVNVDAALGAYLTGASAGLSRNYSFVYSGASGSTPAYTLQKTFKLASVNYQYSSVYVSLNDASITEGCLYVNGKAYEASYFDWNKTFCIAVTLPDELKSYIAGYTDTLSQDYRLQFVAKNGRSSEVLLYQRTSSGDEVENPQILQVIADSDRLASCVYIYTNGYCGPTVCLNGDIPDYAVYSKAKKAYRVQVPGELYRYVAGEDGALSQAYTLDLVSSTGCKASKMYHAVLSLKPRITEVSAPFGQAAVYVKDCACSDDSDGGAVLKLNGEELSDVRYYSSSYDAHFEASVPNALISYLTNKKAPAQTYRLEVISSAGEISAPWIVVGTSAPECAVTGCEADASTRSILLSGQGFTAITEIVFCDQVYEAEFISDTQVRIKDVPEEIIETILIGQDKGAGIVYDVLARLPGGKSCSYQIVPKEKLLITDINSAGGEWLTLTLSDEKVTADGYCYINGCEYEALYQEAGGYFLVCTNDYRELPSYCQNWTDTLSRDYSIKFVCADGRESIELAYQQVLPDAVDEPAIEGISADYDGGLCCVAYVQVSGYGGTLKINGEAPQYALYSRAKRAYRVSVPYDLGRYLQNRDGALSRDYVFTLTDEGGAEISDYTVKAMRSLQPNIVGIAPAGYDGETAYADVYVRNCPGYGDAEGQAAVQINGEVPASCAYNGAASCAYFRVGIPAELYRYLQGEQNALEGEYRFVAVSDAGLTSDERVFPYQSDGDTAELKPMVTGVGAGASAAEALVYLSNFSEGTLYINGVPAVGAYDDERQAFVVEVDYQLGAYLSGSSRTLPQGYVFRAKSADGAVSDPYILDKVVLAKPVINGVTQYSSSSTTLAYLNVSSCTAGSVYMDGVKRSVCTYVASKKAFKINVTSEVGKYLTQKNSVLPNDHTFKVVSADGVSSAVYTLKATVARPVISKVVKYSAADIANAYVYCSNCSAGSAVYVNGVKRTCTYISSKKALKVNIPTPLGRYLTGKSKTLASNYSFKVINKVGSISAVKTVAAVSDAPSITSVGKYLSTYVYLNVKNCPNTAKVYLNGTQASRAYVSSKNAFRVKVPQALGSYLLDKTVGLDQDYAFKVVSGSKTSKVYTVKKAAATPAISHITAAGRNTANVYVSGITTGGTVYLDGYAAANGKKYSAGAKAFTGVVIPEELAAFLRGESAYLSRSYKFTVKSSQGKTSAAKTISKVFPASLPAITAVLPDSESWLKLRVDNCTVGRVYVNGAEVPSFYEAGYFYAFVDEALAQFVRGDRDNLAGAYTVKLVRADGKSSASVSIDSGRRPYITRVAGDPEYSNFGLLYIDSGICAGSVLVNGVETAAAYSSFKKAFSVALPAELVAFLKGESAQLSQDYVFQFIADGGLSSAKYTVKAAVAGGADGGGTPVSEQDADELAAELSRKNEELHAEAEEAGVELYEVIALDEAVPLLLQTEEAREAAEERVAQKKQALLNGDADWEGEAEAEGCDAELTEDIQEALDAEDEFLAEAELDAAEEDEYVFYTNSGAGAEAAGCDGNDGSEIAVPDDRAAAEFGEALEANLVPRIVAVCPVSGCADAVAVLALNVADCRVVYIGGQVYRAERDASGCLLVRGLSAETVDSVLSGEREVRLVSRVLTDEGLKSVSGVGRALQH